MLFVVLMQYSKPLTAVDAVRADHIRHLESWAARGIVQAWARRDPPSGGVIIAVAPSRKALEATIAEDPYVRAGVAKAEIVEFDTANVRGALKT